jgi:hypothetical protein
MRLTLRTLLAYLDGVLDRQDAKDLQEKVAQGRLAKGMVDRIQSVIKRPKLAAPKVDARGTAGDANVVAEYLDNTMQALHVAEFEQACLAEDARLAEVASCHQILTIVLAKPATVSSELRDRVHRLGSSEFVPGGRQEVKVHDGPLGLESLQDSIVERNGKRFRIDQNHRGLASENEIIRATPERAIAATGLELNDKLISHVPEYLKSGNSGHWSSTFTILGLLAALVFVAWLSLGSLEDVRDLLYQNTSIERPSSEDSTAQQSRDVAASNSTDGTKILQRNATPPDPSIHVDRTTSTSPIVEANSAPPGPLVEAVAPPMIPETTPQTPIEPMATEPPAVAPPAVTPPAVTPPAVTPPAVPPPVAPLPIDPTTPANEPLTTSAKAWLHWQPETKESAMALVFATRESKGAETSIRRLTNGESLDRDEQLIVPPAFRTEFHVAPGIRWVVSDETALESLTSDAVDSAAVQMRLGRALVHATPDCQSLVLKTPIDSIAIQMKDASSIVAIELRYQRRVGRTVEQAIESLSADSIGMMQPVLTLVCVAGEATLERIDDEPLQMEVGQGFEWVADTPVRPIIIDEVPWWYRTSFQRPIDAEAAQDLASRMADDSTTTTNATTNNQEAKSTLEQLRALIDSRRSETAALAMRSMFLLGEYSKCFGSDAILSNPASRPHRSVILDSFYQSLGAHAQGVMKVKEVIEAADLPRAARLIGLISLPDDSQLADGQDRVLVESLGSPFVDERILAIYQLNAILGKEHGFQSDRPSPDSIQQWKRLLNSAKIRWPK